MWHSTACKATLRRDVPPDREPGDLSRHTWRVCKFTVAAALRQEPVLPRCRAAVGRAAQGPARSRLSREILLPELLAAALIPLMVMGEQSPAASLMSLGEPSGTHCCARLLCAQLGSLWGLGKDVALQRDTRARETLPVAGEEEPGRSVGPG